MLRKNKLVKKTLSKISLSENIRTHIYVFH
jgi:hypothetical protein